MAERKIVVIDAGHGGADPGAKFEGRQEKDDALRLALAVGNILSQNGVDVRYTRTDDTYNTPLEKATMANEAAGGLFRIDSPECHADTRQRLRSYESRI